MKRVLIAVCVMLAVSAPVFGDARYAGKEAMIREADAIVVATVTKVEKDKTRGRHWTYGQKAMATVEQCLKGGLAAQIEIRGMEDFICAQCRFETGRFLLFLRRDGELWAGSNWHLSIRANKDGKVAWFKPGGTLFDSTEQPLDAVLAEVRKTLEAANAAPPQAKP